MPFSTTPTNKSKWIILEGVIEENMFRRFFTTYTPFDDKDPTKGNTGKTWYKIIGYTNTVAEAQIKLFGRVMTQSSE